MKGDDKPTTYTSGLVRRLETRVSGVSIEPVDVEASATGRALGLTRSSMSAASIDGICGMTAGSARPEIVILFHKILQFIFNIIS